MTVLVTAAKERVRGAAFSLSPDPDLFDRDIQFHCGAPIGSVSGRDAVLEQVYAPLAVAFPAAEKVPYLYFAGQFGGAVWVGATGNIVGEMTAPWLGVPGGVGQRYLRFGEFYKVVHGKIVEIRCLFDIPRLAAEAGFDLFPPFGGDPALPTGPKTELALNGRLQDETDRTADLVEAMITGGCNRLSGSDWASMGMADFWHEDMGWYGPWGVGSTHGLSDFATHAQGPSVKSFPNRRGTWPKTCFIAEGTVAGFTGWPSLVGDFTGAPFRGIEATGGPISQTIMDFYVRRGDKLAENWVLIDLIGFGDQCGVDLLAPLKEAA